MVSALPTKLYTPEEYLALEIASEFRNGYRHGEIVSIKAYDRDEKFAAYRSVATIQEYLLIDQYQPHVEQYIKQGDNQWLFAEYNGLEAKVLVAAVGVEIALLDLYGNVEF
jgi:Uma2 family endonuclease